MVITEQYQYGVEKEVCLNSVLMSSYPTVLAFSSILPLGFFGSSKPMMLSLNLETLLCCSAHTALPQMGWFWTQDTLPESED